MPSSYELLTSDMVAAHRVAGRDSSGSGSLIALEGVSKWYGSVAVLNRLNMDVPAGAYVALCGTSGAGKTTLLGIIGLLEAPSSGVHLYRGVSTRELGDRQLAELRNKAFGFVFQQFSLIPRLSAWQNVARPLTFSRVPRREHRHRALELLDWLGLADRADHRPAQLSGGEQQRVAIARALITDPEVILADEPTGNLPPEQWGPIMDALDLLHRAGKTIVLVTHNPRVAERAGNVVWLRAGKFETDARVRTTVTVGGRGAADPTPRGADAPPEAVDVRLGFLGATSAHFRGQELKVQPRAADILTMLAANPAGLTGEQLLLLVYGEDGRSGTMKAALSRLRKVVTINSQPYRLEGTVVADFITLEGALRNGDVRGALGLYAGSLLPRSEAPGVVELRERLDDAVRRAVLEAHEGDLAWQLAELLDDDLEVWEAAVAQLPEGDPRKLLATVRAERLRGQWE